MTSQAFIKAEPINLDQVTTDLNSLITPNVVVIIQYNNPNGIVNCALTITGPQSTAITNYFSTYSFLDNSNITLNLSNNTFGNSVLLNMNQTADRTLYLPDTSDTLVARNTTDTLTNKIITSSTNNVTASSLFSNNGTNIISIIGSANPTNGTVLTATSSNTAAWSTVVPTESNPATVDAFGRLRVSEPYNLFSSKQLTNDLNNIQWSAVTGTGGTSTYDTNKSQTTLAVTTTQFSYAVRQSKQYFNYQPGKSHLISITFTFGDSSNGSLNGIRKRVGYFNTNNGIFLQTLNDAISLGIRTSTSGSVINTNVAQSSWNIDQMDGSGPSGFTLDFLKSQILVIDFQWLGVGSVRVGFYINDDLYYVHYFNNANILAGVYMAIPNLPVRFEIMNVHTSNPGPNTGSLQCICASVISEGGTQYVGTTRGINFTTTGFTINVTGLTTYPLLIFRLKSTYPFATISLSSFSVCTSTASVFLIELCLNPTISGTLPAYTGVTNSSLEFIANTSNAITISNKGTIVYNSYVVQTNNSRFTPSITNSILNLGSTADVTVTNANNTSTGTVIAPIFDVATVCITYISGNAATFYASLVYTDSF